VAFEAINKKKEEWGEEEEETSFAEKFKSLANSN
jgi:hypothetical protein